ncbi:MAG: aminotransferase class V-fold PLP-dependent enzyme [Candidatus Latescibacteria bacterium]|nr:aminotransferase class V-fold PLP-dependent enzyme [Candidatus Latescibacterota bacterium]
MNIGPLLSPTEFIGLDGITHLCTGGEAPWLNAQAEVYAEFARLKSAGYPGRKEIYARGERCRTRMGQLWGVPSERIALMPSAAEGMNWLSRGLDWRAGDNIVTTNLEFPSVAYAWSLLRRQGVEVRMVPHQNWIVSEADLLGAVDGRTRVLAVSHVSFYTGQCLNIARLADGVRSKGTLLAVDATHSSGVLRVPAGLTDLTVSSSYKWMLATHGVAPCYLSNRAEAQTETTCFGWHNLDIWPKQGAERYPDVDVKLMPERLEPGNPAMVVVMFLDQALEVLLRVGVDRIENHARDLSELVSAGLEQLGYTVISPKFRAGRSGNTCFLVEDAKGMEDRLTDRGVLCWGEYGRVRVSTHLYNGSADVEQFLKVLAEVT